MASSRPKKTIAKKRVTKKKVINTDIKKEIIEKLLSEKRAEIQKKLELVNKVKQSLQNEAKKLSELEGAIIVLHELLTGEKVE
jgi:hypothetical protein